MQRTVRLILKHLTMSASMLALGVVPCMANVLLGNYPHHLLTVDPNGHGDTTTLALAVAQIPTTGADAISLDHPWTILLAPGIHDSHGSAVVLSGLKGLSIIGLGGPGGTYYLDTTGSANSLIEIDDSNVRIEGITIGGKDNHSGASIKRVSPGDGPVELRIVKCHFDWHLGDAIAWDKGSDGDSLDIFESVWDNIATASGTGVPIRLTNAPDLTRISGCHFRNQWEKSGVLIAAIASSGDRTVEFSGNQVLLGDVQVNDPVISIESTSNSAGTLNFYATGNAIYMNALTTGVSETGGIRLRRAAGVTGGGLKAYLTGNAIDITVSVMLTVGYGIKVDAGEAILTGNTIKVLSVASPAYGLWARLSGTVTSTGNWVSVNGETSIDLLQENTGVLNATATVFDSSSGTVGGDLKVQGDLIVKHRLEIATGTDACAGTGTILTGQNCTTINTNCVTASSMITTQYTGATALSNMGSRIKVINIPAPPASRSFVVCTGTNANNPGANMPFNWLIVN